MVKDLVADAHDVIQQADGSRLRKPVNGSIGVNNQRWVVTCLGSRAMERRRLEGGQLGPLLELGGGRGRGAGVGRVRRLRRPGTTSASAGYDVCVGRVRRQRTR